ncbi:MAG: tRNA (adenosine(37)-N6)-dimethylallyltransferase MiaA [Endomicrobium sp.]|jgi:tRNA dimethylallyltransferase|nr:tRNA (adenosine(37)-N6)-dimethylallyltransferase MiaA [Endomicrobium sp.]
MNIIVISGPTASGKTKKAIEFCKRNNGEIISCDSRQIYKYLDIGTNKEGILLQDGTRNINGVIQHLTDIVSPDQEYSAVDFMKNADAEILKILYKHKVPVVTGGTGLYIKTLLYGLDFISETDKTLRKELKSKCCDELYEILLKLDPQAAEKNKKNPQRLVRALEINILSKKTIKANLKYKKTPRYSFKHYSLCVDNKILYRKINDRCKYMIENGMIEETQKIVDMGFKANCPGLSAIGYKHVLQYLNNNMSKDDLIMRFSRDTRHYAKRQNTWFKAQPDVEFIYNTI